MWALKKNDSRGAKLSMSIPRCRQPSTRLPVAKAQSAPLQVKITAQGSNHTLQAPSIDIMSPTTMTSGGYVQSLQLALGEAGI